MNKRNLCLAAALCLCLCACGKGDQAPVLNTPVADSRPQQSGILTDVGQAETLQDYYDQLVVLPDACPSLEIPLKKSALAGAREGDKIVATLLRRGAGHADHRAGVGFVFGSAEEMHQRLHKAYTKYKHKQTEHTRKEERS